MPVVTMKEMLDSGVHFGHQTRRWNPKMKRFIFTERNGIYIIDLQQTLSYVDSAYEFVKETVAHGGTVMFIGTKKQAQEAIAEQASRVGMPYVNQRWLGGMLTNFQTVHKRIQRMKELATMEENGWEGTATKKEQLILTREKIKLEKTLGGIRDMTKVPSAVWIVDTKKEHIAVGEAHKLGVPVIAILDTNCDPDEVDYKIPGNDDAIRSAALLTRVIADAVADGLMARAASQANAGKSADVDPGAAAEPLPEWERDLLQPEQPHRRHLSAVPAPGSDRTVDGVSPRQLAEDEGAAGYSALIELMVGRFGELQRLMASEGHGCLTLGLAKSAKDVDTLMFAEKLDMRPGNFRDLEEYVLATKIFRQGMDPRLLARLVRYSGDAVAIQIVWINGPPPISTLEMAAAWFEHALAPVYPISDLAAMPKLPLAESAVQPA